MQDIIIEKSKTSPGVSLSKTNEIFEFEGRSMMSTPSEFYEPLIEWFSEYAKDPNSITTVRFRLDYFNTTSHQNIIQILLVLKLINDANNEVKVIWEYHEQDEEMQQIGEEIAMLVEIPFDYIPIV